MPTDTDLDARIRTMVGRTVAEAPQAPDALHVARRGADLADERDTPRRGGRALVGVAGAAAALLLVAGAVAVVQSTGNDGRTDVATAPRGEHPRYVLGVEPDGYRLVGWEDRTATDAADLRQSAWVPPPGAVSVFRRTDGVVVRVGRPFDRATFAPSSEEREDDEAWLRQRVAEAEDATVAEVLGTTALRLGHRGLATSSQASTFFLRQQETLVEVDVYGLAAEDAGEALSGFTARVDGGYEPPTDGTFTVLGDLPHGKAPSPSEAWTGAAYARAEDRARIRVQSRRLRAGEDSVLLARRDRAVGTIERWGGREVLTQERPALGLAQVSFVEGGDLVIVDGPADLMPELVAGLRAASPAEWGALVDEGSERLHALPVVAEATVGERKARVEAHQAPGADRPAGWCLTVDGITACAADPSLDPGTGTEQPWDSSPQAFDVLLDGEWWVFGWSGTSADSTVGSFDVSVRFDGDGVDRIEQAAVGGTWWWAGPVPDDATVLWLEASRPSGSGLGYPASRPAS